MAAYGIELFFKRYFGNLDFKVEYCGTVHCALLFNASLRSVSPSRAPVLSRAHYFQAPATQASLMHVRIFKTLD